MVEAAWLGIVMDPVENLRQLRPVAVDPGIFGMPGAARSVLMKLQVLATRRLDTPTGLLVIG